MKRYFGVLAVAIVAIPVAALASHGKAGLWNITVTISGLANMPDMSKLPPEAQAQMKKMGMSMNGGSGSITTQHCMTQAEVMMDAPPTNAHNKDCTISNLNISGHSMSGDMACHGDFTGTGHMNFTYDSDTHYTGVVSITGTANGQSATHETKFEGNWVSADCGGVTH